ncbi:uncharacterized protein LOC112603419 [Melanaphis sacchari]|uniref:uncharacterized protein LOC112603419 n=1 Tax=Melanaphis sacchari TaxID=742174 RepID=UPI000DC140BC|nr:uncharacterized protein LOC112603419 [Melanaphis sacchari]
MDKDSGIKGHDKCVMHKTCIAMWEACQNIAQRGYDESENSLNKGNFIELLQLCAKRDVRLKNKIECLPKNGKYTHHSIQNQLFSIMSKLVLQSISNEIKECKYFAILADETNDISKTEQLSIMVRYFHKNIIHERFLGFVPCSSLNAQSLFNYIKCTLSDCEIDINNCVAQTYDGAAVMSGNANDVQAIFQREVPQAIYTHCYNHRLNLVVVDVCKNIPEVATFFSLLQKIYNFISRSTVHTEFIELQKKLSPKHKCVELKNYLQRADSDISSSCILVNSLVSHLNEYRNTIENFNELMNEVNLAAENNNIKSLETAKKKRTVKLPTKFTAFLTESITETRAIQNTNDLKLMIFYPVIDRMVSELNKRFTNNSPILKGIGSFNPISSTFLDMNKIQPLSLHYGTDSDSLLAKLKLLPKLIKRYKEENNCEIKTILDLVYLLEKYKMAFCETYILCTISIIIPPSSAGAERTFSSLRQVKIYLRNHMSNEKLKSIAILAIEKKASKNLNLDMVVDKFTLQIGQMTILCPKCHAKKWKDETHSLCCADGKVVLHQFEDLPDPIKSLIDNSHPLSKHFFDNSRRYNTLFQMTSFGANEVAEGNFMSSFKIQGQVHHLIESDQI